MIYELPRKTLLAIYKVIASLEVEVKSQMLSMVCMNYSFIKSKIFLFL
jgi:hypothetical protein